MFLILLTDIDKSVAYAFVSSFADNTQVVHRIKTPEDVHTLQEDLNTNYQWSSNNNKKFNSDKFECITYGKKKELHDNTHYSDTNTVITPMDEINDLGVILSSNCLFKKQINEIVKTANKLCAWILQTFKTRALKLMILL